MAWIDVKMTHKKHIFLFYKKYSIVVVNFWPNRRFFVLFGEMRHFLQLSAQKLTQTPNHGSLVEKVASFAKSTIFRAKKKNKQRMVFLVIFAVETDHFLGIDSLLGDHFMTEKKLERKNRKPDFTKPQATRKRQ